MAHLARKRKCLHCKGFFHPDHRNVGRQHYCSQPECRQVSKTESQQRWRQKPENLDHFKGKANVQRVQQWRLDHPGYWRRKAPEAEETTDALQETLTPESLLTRDDTVDQRLDKLEALLRQGTEQVEAVAPLFAALLAIPLGDRYPPPSLTPQRQKEKMIEALVDQLLGLARQQPVWFIWEDAHWSDPTRWKVLDVLISRVAEARVLVVLTYRPEFAPPWGGLAHVTTHTFNRMTRRQAAALVAEVSGGKTLPEEELDQIVAKTDGVSLFVEELTKTVLEAGFLRDAGDHYTLEGLLPPLPIPTTLHDSLIIRAITSPTGVLSSRAIGQVRAPRHASDRTLARIRALAVMSHQRLAMRGPSVSRMPPTKLRAAQTTASGPTVPRSNASAASMARPSRSAGSTMAVFITIPAREPSTSCPTTCRK